MLSSFTVYSGIWEAGQLNADNFRKPKILANGENPKNIIDLFCNQTRPAERFNADTILQIRSLCMIFNTVILL